MGFRSTFTTLDYAVTWPDWFVAKYGASIRYDEGRGGHDGSISSNHEAKTYMLWQDLPQDIQRALYHDPQEHTLRSFVLLYLHECGGVTRVEIRKDSIQFTEPTAWERVPDVTHDYCYGCSDVERSTPKDGIDWKAVSP